MTKTQFLMLLNESSQQKQNRKVYKQCKIHANLTPSSIESHLHSGSLSYHIHYTLSALYSCSFRLLFFLQANDRLTISLSFVLLDMLSGFCVNCGCDDMKFESDIHLFAEKLVCILKWVAICNGGNSRQHATSKKQNNNNNHMPLPLPFACIIAIKFHPLLYFIHGIFQIETLK